MMEKLLSLLVVWSCGLTLIATHNISEMDDAINGQFNVTRSGMNVSMLGTNLTVLERNLTVLGDASSFPPTTDGFNDDKNMEKALPQPENISLLIVEILAKEDNETISTNISSLTITEIREEFDHYVEVINKMIRQALNEMHNNVEVQKKLADLNRKRQEELTANETPGFFQRVFDIDITGFFVQVLQFILQVFMYIGAALIGLTCVAFCVLTVVGVHYLLCGV